MTVMKTEVRNHRFWLLIVFAINLTTIVPSLRAASINESTIIRCTLDARRDMSHIGMDRRLVAKKSARDRFHNWVMQETPAQPRSPVTLFWLPKTENSRPILRVQQDGQDRVLAKLLSRTKSNLLATVVLSDQSVSRAWLVSVNFRRELAMITEVQSNTGGMRGAMFAFDCLFDSSSTITPGLLGERFEYLDK